MTRRPDRISFRFSARARHAACLVSTAEGGFVPARWDLGGASPRYREGASTESTATQVLPTDDGELLLLRSTVGSGRHRLALTGPDGGPGPATTAGPARPRRSPPGGCGWSPAARRARSPSPWRPTREAAPGCGRSGTAPCAWPTR
ncbi:hypothetical protein ACF07T_36520 [Streptomyces sp. NPDC015184]|uniref:hypothetical protein n=1 Tax=Streptomyces sp. NPDC015184 TaxID=3364946 RepID=UPI0036F94170